MNLKDWFQPITLFSLKAPRRIALKLQGCNYLLKEKYKAEDFEIYFLH